MYRVPLVNVSSGMQKLSFKTHYSSNVRFIGSTSLGKIRPSTLLLVAWVHGCSQRVYRLIIVKRQPFLSGFGVILDNKGIKDTEPSRRRSSGNSSSSRRHILLLDLFEEESYAQRRNGSQRLLIVPRQASKWRAHLIVVFPASCIFNGKLDASPPGVDTKRMVGG